MSDTSVRAESGPLKSEEVAEQSTERSGRITTVAWMVGIVGVFAALCIESQMSIGSGIAFAAVAAMVTVVAVAMLRAKK